MRPPSPRPRAAHTLLALALPGLVVVALPGCDTGGEGGEGGASEALFDESPGPLPDEMQAGIPQGILPLQRVFVEGEWRAGWVLARDPEDLRGAAEIASQVYVFCRDNEWESCPMQSPPVGHNVFPTIPLDDDYSPYWQVVKVRVPVDYEANAIKSLATIERSGYETEALPMIVNCPLHGIAAGLEGNGGDGEGSVATVQGWYDGWRIYYWGFGTVPFEASGEDAVVTSSEAYLTYRPGASTPESEPAQGDDINGNGDARDTNTVIRFAGEGTFGGRVRVRAAEVDADVPLALDDPDPTTSAVQSVAALDALIDEGRASLRGGGEAVELWNFALRPLP